jgi:hypothetical protein
MFCMAPLILAGYLLTLHPNASHVTSFDEPMLEAQTCESGAGLDAKITASGLSSLQAQYGFAFTGEQWRLILTPKAGGALLPHHVPELTSPLNFSLGFQTTLGYEQGRLSLEYWHQSNAHLGSSNAGLDLIALMGGWSF